MYIRERRTTGQTLRLIKPAMITHTGYLLEIALNAKCKKVKSKREKKRERAPNPAVKTGVQLLCNTEKKNPEKQSQKIVTFWSMHEQLTQL